MNDERLLTVTDVKKRLKIGRDAAYRLMRDKRFPALVIGKTRYVTQAALEKWIKIDNRRNY